MFYVETAKMSAETSLAEGYAFRAIVIEQDADRTRSVSGVYGANSILDLAHLIEEHEAELPTHVCKGFSWTDEPIELDCLSLAEGMEATCCDWN